MQKIILSIVLLAILFTIGFSEVFAPAIMTPAGKERIIKYVLRIQPKIHRERLTLLVNTADELANYYQISPMVILAIIWQETGFRNIYGDHGKAVGYCQIHKATYQYLQLYYPRLDSIPYRKLIRLPKLQVELIYMYLRVLMDTRAHNSITDAITMYNGQTTYWNNYTFGVYKKTLMLMKLNEG